MRKLIIWISVGAAVVLGVAIYFILILTNQGNPPVWTIPEGDAQSGRVAILAYGCHGCHVISGIREATGRVGPKLEDINQQIYIGGVLPNNPENMIRWIMNPQIYSPATAMPDLGVSEQDARDITAYLFKSQ